MAALDAARALAKSVSAMAPIAVREAKQLIDLSTQVRLEAGLAAELRGSEKVFDTDDMIEGVSAFFEKRPPEFEGR